MSDRLRPPGRVGAVREECVNRPLVELLGRGHPIAQLDDGLLPVLRPWGPAVVERRFRGCRDLFEAQGRLEPVESSADHIFDSLLARS
jgi:hypothetical protein